VKNIKEIVAFLSGLNGWGVLALLCTVFLVWFAFDCFRRWLDSRFAAISTDANNRTKIDSDRYQEFTEFRNEVIEFMNQHRR